MKRDEAMGPHKIGQWVGVAAGVSMAVGVLVGALVFPRYGWSAIALLCVSLLMGSVSVLRGQR